MKSLDAHQQAELDALLESNSWTARSVPVRLGLLILVTAPALLIFGLLAFLATARWLLIPSCAGLVYLLVLSPYVVAPAWFIRWNFRAWTVSDAEADAAKRKGPGLP